MLPRTIMKGGEMAAVMRAFVLSTGANDAARSFGGQPFGRREGIVDRHGHEADDKTAQQDEGEVVGQKAVMTSPSVLAATVEPIVAVAGLDRRMPARITGAASGSPTRRRRCQPVIPIPGAASVIAAGSVVSPVRAFSRSAFASVLVASRVDPFMPFKVVERQAGAWGSALFNLGRV